MTHRKDMHRKPAALPMAYFLTMRTHGTWLHGDKRGSVDRLHNQFDTPLLPPDPTRLAAMERRMRSPAVEFAAQSAALIELTVREVCAHRSWRLYALAARSNHLHVVASGPVAAERMINDFKAWCTRRLREAGHVDETQTVWAAHGSTPHLWTQHQLVAAIDYVKNWQGGPLQKTWQQVDAHRERRTNPRGANTASSPGARPDLSHAEGAS